MSSVWTESQSPAPYSFPRQHYAYFHALHPCGGVRSIIVISLGTSFDAPTAGSIDARYSRLALLASWDMDGQGSSFMPEHADASHVVV